MSIHWKDDMDTPIDMATAINMATDIIMVIFQKNPKSHFGKNGSLKKIQVNNG